MFKVFIVGAKRYFLCFILFLFSFFTEEVKSLPQTSRAQIDSVQKGTASFYGKKFNGRRTSSGERFCNDSLMAAHKTLPFGTMVRVINLKNNEVVIVKITDRLPKNSKRVIDLSFRAAKKLKMVSDGLAKVKLEVLPRK